jgi:hypothetical protein
VCCYNGDSSYPMALRHDLVGVMPFLKKKYLRYQDYKEQTFADIFPPEQWDQAGITRLDAYEMRTCVLINNGPASARHPGFTVLPLPIRAQFSPVYGILVKDFDGDGKADILLGGNFFQSKPEVGIYDASYGLLLKGDGNGNFKPIDARESGISIKGQIKDIIELKAGGKQLFVAARNNEAPFFLEYNMSSK